MWSAALNEDTGLAAAGARISKVYDLADFVRDSVRSVRDAIVIGSLLAVLVLLFFLRDWRATLVAAIALPLTIIGTFGILQLAGGTINLMSMGGLAIAIGLVIDDAIVVVENIHRHRGGGETAARCRASGHRGTGRRGPRLDADDGRRVHSAGLLQGVVGQFFSALSLTLSAAVLLSLVYALLFIPIPAGALPRVRSRARSTSAPAGWPTGYQTCSRTPLRRPAGSSSPSRSRSRRSARCSSSGSRPVSCRRWTRAGSSSTTGRRPAPRSPRPTRC